MADKNKKLNIVPNYKIGDVVWVKCALEESNYYEIYLYNNNIDQYKNDFNENSFVGVAIINYVELYLGADKYDFESPELNFITYEVYLSNGVFHSISEHEILYKIG
jgi:hypothetical protein